MNKFILLLCLYTLFGCKSEIKNKIEIQPKEVTREKFNSEIDTIISEFPKIMNDFNYCDLVKSNAFLLIKPIPYDIPNIDSLSYGFNIDKEKIVFSYQFSAKKDEEDRKIMLSNKKLDVRRIFVKDSTAFSFTGFMPDYSNAKFYSNKKYILIKSQPTDWTGLMNQYEFYQLIDMTKKISYEFFVNEYKGCK